MTTNLVLAIPVPRWSVAQRWQAAVGALLLLVLAAVLLAFNPSSAGFFPLCPFRACTGFDCPGCGTLRGVHQLLRGNLTRALGLNPLMVLSIPLVAYAVFSSVLAGLTPKRLPAIFVSAKSVWILLAVILGYAFVRNIPVYPLSVLAS